LTLALDTKGRLCIEFDSFQQVYTECADMAVQTPWNRNNSKYTILEIPLNSEGIVDQILLPESYSRVAKWQPELVNRVGVYTGDRLIFCKELFAYEIVIALIKHSKDSVPLATGINCEFSAVWNQYEKKFIVTEYKAKGLKTQLGANNLLRTAVKADEDYPGVYRSVNFGLVDDPRGILALFHLSEYKNSSVVVTLEDKPSKSKFRFRIVDVQADKAPKLQKWLENAERAFRISVVRSVAFDCFLEHDLFGLIDMGTHISLAKGNSSAVVWVMRSLPHTKQAARHARTPFVVVSVGDQEPNEEFAILFMYFKVDLPDESFAQGDTCALHPTSPTISVLEAEESSAAVPTPGNIFDAEWDLATQEAMKRMGLNGGKDSSSHMIRCTNTSCAPDCPTLEMVMLIMDTVPNFMELLAAENPSLFTRCVNQLFI
uniref:Tudor domain-containing protein n=1 Tax=Angiostrongylus cantonensis TaxID=6313 RepID=A0A158P7T9_ANGCA